MDIEAGGGARFELASDQSLLVYFARQNRKGRAEARPLQTQITLQANERVRKLLRLLQLEPIEGFRNLHPAYCSLLVKFDALRLRHEEVEAILRRCLERLDEVILPEPHQVEIPVCYGGEYGPDLAEVCAMHGMTATKAIEMHAAPEYLVYFLWFVHGFAYLGGLPEWMVAPLRDRRRRMVLSA